MHEGKQMQKYRKKNKSNLLRPWIKLILKLLKELPTAINKKGGNQNDRDGGTKKAQIYEA